jgi:hypothetical protein
MDIMSREAIVKQGLEPSEVEWRKAGKKQYAEVILKSLSRAPEVVGVVLRPRNAGMGEKASPGLVKRPQAQSSVV